MLAYAGLHVPECLIGKCTAAFSVWGCSAPGVSVELSRNIPHLTRSAKLATNLLIEILLDDTWQRRSFQHHPSLIWTSARAESANLQNLSPVSGWENN